MKTTTFLLILFLTGLDLWAQTEPTVRQAPRRLGPTNAPAATPSLPNLPVLPTTTAAPLATASPFQATSPDVTQTNTNEADADQMIPAGTIDFQGVDVTQVLDVYAKLVNRTVLRAGLPASQIILRTETPLTRSETIEALQAVLALNGISVINIGDKFIKALPSEQAYSAGAEFNTQNATNLPNLGSFVTHIVQLKYTKPTEMAPIIAPFAKLNSIIPLDGNGILIIRDYAENIKRMLEMIARVDVEGGSSEIVSEVIPIRYAMAEDIANALNNLGGAGGSTVSVGSTSPSVTGASVSGLNRTAGGQTGANYPGGGGLNRTTGGFGTTPTGTPTAGTTFQQRLNAIVNRAANGQEQIQVFGTAKIIADQRSNALLVFATASDLERIKGVIAKLDVLLAQVLIESVIMDVGFNNSWSLGVSAAQNPKAFSPSQQIAGGGGSANGSTFFNFLGTNSLFNLGTNASAIFGNVLPGGLSYFGNIGPTWDVALQAAGADSLVTVIQRPRIQTSQAKTATFFVGQTVPYVTSTYYGGTTTGNSSSYSQLSVGVELDVTPFINPDGLVVMDIAQEIDDLNGTTHIDGVGDVPNTTKRTLNSEIAVKDQDTIVLGGFIRSGKQNSKSGVPLLQDIPILGALFSQRTSSKTREETMVLMRPTVLRTPEIAAAQAIKEEQRLPGIAHAEADDEKEAQKLIEAEQKAELKAAKSKKKSSGVFTVEPSNPKVMNTNSVPQPNPATGLY